MFSATGTGATLGRGLMELIQGSETKMPPDGGILFGGGGGNRTPVRE